MEYPNNVFGNNVILYKDYLNQYVIHNDINWGIKNERDWKINNRIDAYKVVKLTQWELNDKSVKFTKACRDVTNKQLAIIISQYLKNN